MGVKLRGCDITWVQSIQCGTVRGEYHQIPTSVACFNTVSLFAFGLFYKISSPVIKLTLY